MTKNEMYYLILVLGGFATFAVAMAGAMIRERALVRRQSRNTGQRR